MLKFGLIGKHIDYSFSKSYFNRKFKEEQLPHAYVNYDLKSIEEFCDIISKTPNLGGLNVTIPYKEQVIPYLDDLSNTAKTIGAVNTIKITRDKKLIGYNTDHYGFRKSIVPLLKSHHKNALILGTGGASKAIVFALKTLGIDYQFVSRNTSNTTHLTYDRLNTSEIEAHSIIINCTPVGTYPEITECPKIPYCAITDRHLLYDLIYNPSETLFLTKGKAQGATICNGELMLQLQAEKAWRIWNKL